MKSISQISLWLFAALFFSQAVYSADFIGWQWKCKENMCEKTPMTEESKPTALSLAACRLFCNENAVFWPKPTGPFSLGNFLLHLNLNSIDVVSSNPSSPAGQLVQEAGKRFMQHIKAMIPKGVEAKGGRSLVVNVNIENVNDIDITLQTDEKYELVIKENIDGRIISDITAKTYFGARHGLETLTQLIIFDDIRDELQILRDANIKDEPVYPYRGILLDTSRNYVAVNDIKRTIEAMAISKLNTFHWHITDSQSFPFVSKSEPLLSKIGAYTPHKIYTPEDITDIIKYAKVRGVRILPEFDAPAHVGEGWQNTDFVECFKAEPWYNVCVEPPCGQLNPTKPKLYDTLEHIYSDMIELFKPDIFHMGGDEVSVKCWNQTENIVNWMAEKGWGRSEEDFMKLWDYFQTNALERYEKHAGRKDTPIIMWTSTLTKINYVEQYLPKDKYIIQIWTTGKDKQIKELLDRNYRLILSNYDALYFDCGFGAWVGSGNNWCSPYIGWQKVYDNSPALIGGEKRNQILGAEAALWTEQADEQSLDNRLWPRAAAMAERLWSEPVGTWLQAEHRMLVHRERLVERGIAADTLEPQWCLQNQGHCYGQ